MRSSPWSGLSLRAASDSGNLPPVRGQGFGHRPYVANRGIRRKRLSPEGRPIPRAAAPSPASSHLPTGPTVLHETLLGQHNRAQVAGHQDTATEGDGDGD
jgi:hypothetical protein